MREPYTCTCGEKLDGVNNRENWGMLLWGSAWQHVYKEICEKLSEIVLAAHLGEPSGWAADDLRGNFEDLDVLDPNAFQGIVGDIFLGIAGRMHQGRPQAFGLIRLDPFAAHVRIEQPAGPQPDVTDHLGVQSMARSTRQEPVLRVVHVAAYR